MSKVFWITEEQIKAIEDNANREDLDEATMFDDTIADVKVQLIVEVEADGDSFLGRLLSRE